MTRAAPWRFLAPLAAAVVLAAPALAGDDGETEEPAQGAESAPHAGDDHHSSELTDDYIPLQLEGFPERPRYLLELGNPYLGTGRIRPGFKLPTGAVWQPSLILFGTLRTAAQSFDDDRVRVTEIASRLDLFANLQLSGTERLVVGFRNLDRNGLFTSYVIEPNPGTAEFRARFEDDERFQEQLNADIESLYFEGDFGEIFPRLDGDDFGRTDVGFSLGRQPLLFQEGMLIEDSIDGLGLTRNTLLPKGTSNFRATFFLGVNEVHRANVEDREAELFGLLTSTDVRRSTIDADLVYVRGGELTGDMIAGGVSAVQRIGRYNTSFRILGSYAVDDETAQSTNGALAFGELSWTPHYTDDLVYFTAFVAVDEFSSAARGPATGGPLGRAGISFAAVGIGSYGAPLDSRARDVVGGAFGYQKFFGAAKRRQLLAELGLRIGTRDPVADSAAAVVRYQMALGRRFVLVWDGFVGRREARIAALDRNLAGGRFELVIKF